MQGLFFFQVFLSSKPVINTYPVYFVLDNSGTTPHVLISSALWKALLQTRVYLQALIMRESFGAEAWPLLCESLTETKHPESLIQPWLGVSMFLQPRKMLKHCCISCWLLGTLQRVNLACSQVNQAIGNNTVTFLRFENTHEPCVDPAEPCVDPAVPCSCSCDS